MLQIKNITPNTSVNVPTKYEGVGGVPTQLSLRPGVTFDVVDVEMKAYAQGVKADVANYISKNILTVTQYDDVHAYPDRDHIPNYADKCVQGSTPVLASACTPIILPIGDSTTLQSSLPDCNPHCVAISDRSTVEDGLHWDDEVTGLDTAIDAFNNLRDMYDSHAVSLAYHPVAGVAMVGAPPIDLATLLARLVTLRTTFNTHLGAAAHVNADPVNIVPIALPITDLKEAVEMIRIITAHFNSHRLQFDTTGVALTPIQILTNGY